MFRKMPSIGKCHPFRELFEILALIGVNKRKSFALKRNPKTWGLAVLSWPKIITDFPYREQGDLVVEHQAPNRKILGTVL